MNNEKVIELNVEDLTEKEVAEVNQIFRRFIKKYEEDTDRDTAEWLAEQLQEELPGRNQEEIREIAEEIQKSVEQYNEDLADLNNSCRQGMTKENWLAEKLQDSAKGMSVNQFGNYLSRIDSVMETANRQMERAVLSMDGEINQNLNLDGFIAEQYHVNSFNANAVLENSPYRARVCVPEEGTTYGKNSVDIMIDNIQTGDKGIQRYQVKYGKDFDSTRQMLKRGDYHNQRILVPKGQAEVLQEEMPTKTITEHLGGDGDVKTKSEPMTKENMKKLQEEVQEAHKIPEQEWGSYTTKQLAVNIGKQAGNAGVKAALLSTGIGLVSKMAKGEEIESDEVVKTALVTGSDTCVKAAAGGALKVASEKGILSILPPGTPAGTIANIACVGIEDAKILLKVAKGELTMAEAMEQMGRTTVSMYAGLSASVIGAGIGASALSFIPIVGPIVGGIVGGIAGYTAGSKFGEKVFEGAKTVFHKGKEVVGKAVEGLKSVGNAIKDTLFGWL